MLDAVCLTMAPTFTLDVLALFVLIGNVLNQGKLDLATVSRTSNDPPKDIA